MSIVLSRCGEVPNQQCNLLHISSKLEIILEQLHWLWHQLVWNRSQIILPIRLGRMAVELYQ